MRLAGLGGVLALALSCGALASGCGDSVSVVTGPDTGVGGDAQVDGGGDVASDEGATDAAPTDTPQGADAAADGAPTDGAADAADAGEAGADAAIDAGADAATDAGMDATVDVPVDTGPFDAGPVDVGPVDVAPVDTGPTVIRGHAARSLVSAGSRMSSPSYRMVSTLGQSSIHQSVLRSTNYRLRGGLVGASGGSR